MGANETFDVIIGNPPYGIIGDASHYPIHVLRERKALYRQRSLTWRGKYNIYGAFIEHATRLLAPEGKLVFVVPASWLVLDDFVRLREYLATQGRLSVCYLGKVFPKRNVSVVVLVLEKGRRGLALYDGERLAVEKPTYKGERIRFETPELIQMEQEGVAVGELFTIRFAAQPRSASPSRRAHRACTWLCARADGEEPPRRVDRLRDLLLWVLDGARARSGVAGILWLPPPCGCPYEGHARRVRCR